MGARINIDGGSIVIDGVDKLTGSRLSSFNDHRTCMTMTVASLAARGDSLIEGTESVTKSFPGFFDSINRLTTA
jgi:3-phosphoshikimate 1-carboxyvinyltransferase